jgi:hypothetical protein
MEKNYPIVAMRRIINSRGSPLSSSYSHRVRPLLTASYNDLRPQCRARFCRFSVELICTLASVSTLY